MFYITRKATGKVCGRNVSEDSLDLVLSAMPTGVYGVEDSDGNELNVATVRAGRVTYRDCFGPRPEELVLSNGAVVGFAPVPAGWDKV
jgi:hypothetical protein